jgi:pilus assembly protein Flp/PilA
VRAVSRINQLCSDESAQDLVEYALIAALIGLAALAGVKGLAASVKAAYSSISTTLANIL